jgi:hypothetical protein
MKLWLGGLKHGNLLYIQTLNLKNGKTSGNPISVFCRANNRSRVEFHPKAKQRKLQLENEMNYYDNVMF